MTSITARNAAALVAKNGTTMPKATPTRTKTVAKGKQAVAPSKDEAAKAPAPKAAPQPVACNCGCGEMANLGRSYKPGHDARHAGQVGRALAAKAPGATQALEALAPKLQEKARRFADNAAKAEAKKAAAKSIREAAKAQLAEALAAI